MRVRFAGRAVGRRPRRAVSLAIGLAGMAAAAATLYVGFTAADRIPGRSYYTLHAEFVDADNLAHHGQVRIGGRLVGQVLNPRVERGRATVDLQLDEDVRPLRSDTTLRVRPRSVIGVRFLDVAPGRRGRPLEEGETIPAAQTSSARPPDEALETFDAHTRERTRTLLRELGTATAGRGEDAGEALALAPAFLADAGSVARAVRDRHGAFGELVRQSRTAVAAAVPVRKEIAHGFRPAARALAPLAEQRDALRAALAEAPGALEDARVELRRLDPLIAELGVLAREAQPVLAIAPAALVQTDALLREARPALRRAPATLELARRAVAPALSLLARVAPVLPDVDAALAAGTPPLGEIASRECDVLRAFRNFADVLSFGNASGNVLRFNLVGGSQETLSGAGPGSRIDAGVHANPYPRPCEAGTERVRP